MRAFKGIAKKALGIILVLIGIIALITPLTPGAWLGLIGLELLGLRVLFQDKVKHFTNLIHKRYKSYRNK